MKFYLLILLSFTHFYSSAQIKTNARPGAENVLKPEIYLDSVQSELEYFDATSTDIKEIKKGSGHTADKIYYTSKNPGPVKMLSYVELRKKYFPHLEKPVVLLINSRFVKNFRTVNIDSSYIESIEAEKGEDYNELKNIYPGYAIVNIKTKKFLLNNARPVIILDEPEAYEPQ